MATALAVLAALSAVGRLPRDDAALVLDAVPVGLEGSAPAATVPGALRFMGGLWLRSDDPRFGGLSDLRVSPDGSRLLAVTDCGHGFTASLAYGADGGLAGLANGRLLALSSPDGGPLALGEGDAESLVAGADELEVGFEGRTRVLAYAARPVFAGAAQPVSLPPGLGECGSNGGLEAMAATGDGRRLLICESRRRASLSVPAWVGRNGSWREREYPLLFDGGWANEPFRPTAAALLPSGDLAVLERRFPPIGVRLVRLTRETLEATGPLQPQEIARVEPPLPVDNFEGLDVRVDASGRTLVYLVSDDNNCAKVAGSRGRSPQRTLLLLFALEAEGGVSGRTQPARAIGASSSGE